MRIFDSYRYFVAMKLHFNNDKYDFVKYNGKVGTCSVSSFDKRKDKYFFNKLCKTYSTTEYMSLLISNLLVNKTVSSSDLNSQECIDIYLDYQKRTQNMKRTFSDECSLMKLKCNGEFDDIFRIKENLPIIVKLLVSKQISYETYIIIDTIFNFTKVLDKKLVDDVIYKDVSFTVTKYKSLLKIGNIQTYKDIMKEIFINDKEES